MSRERRTGSGGAQRAVPARAHGRDVRVAAALSAGLVTGILAAGALLAPVATFKNWPVVSGGDESGSAPAVTLPGTFPSDRSTATGRFERDPLTGGVIAPFGGALR